MELALGLVEYLARVEAFGVLGLGGFNHSCASSRVRKDLYMFPGYLCTCRGALLHFCISHMF